MSTNTTNDVSLNTLTNGEYAFVTKDMNTALHTVGYMHMSIYTNPNSIVPLIDSSGRSFFADASGLLLALDNNNNPIQSKVLRQTTYRYPHLDASGNTIDGYMTFFFDDGSSFSNYDALNASYIYRFDGIVPPILKYLT